MAAGTWPPTRNSLRLSMTMTAIFAALQKSCFTEAHQGLRKLKPLSMLGETEQLQISQEWRAICSLSAGCKMGTAGLNSRVQSLVAEYSLFWQFWPQFEQTDGERRLVVS
jgi:hypothetical protein